MTQGQEERGGWLGRPVHNLGNWRSIGALAAETVADLRFQHQINRIYARGPRVVAELLAEIGAERSITTIIETKLDRYAEIDEAALDVIGGREFPPMPLHGVTQ